MLSLQLIFSPFVLISSLQDLFSRFYAKSNRKKKYCMKAVLFGDCKQHYYNKDNKEQFSFIRFKESEIDDSAIKNKHKLSPIIYLSVLLIKDLKFLFLMCRNSHNAYYWSSFFFFTAYVSSTLFQCYNDFETFYQAKEACKRIHLFYTIFKMWEFF